MTESTPVTRALDALQIPYRVFQHTGPVETLEQAANERGQEQEQVIRSLVFRVTQGEYVMVLMAGSQLVSWGALRQYLGVSRVTMAHADELRAVTGYEIGAVGPFGLPQSMRILIDPSVLEPEEISIGSGVRGTAIILASADLKRALPDAEIVKLA
jgi:Cys-tRNA(Pro)/Cys-tRNA(Cys) deacylase